MPRAARVSPFKAQPVSWLSRRPRPWRSALAAVACAASIAAGFMGCGSEPPRAPSLMRPIDEGHAVSIIARELRAAHIEPERNRIIHVGPNLAELRLDVAAKNAKWGIAYITNQDGAALADILPTRRDPDTFLMLRASGEGEDDARAVLLFAGDYLQDDLAGDQHTATTIAAEQKLQEAVRHVIRRATDERWP